MQNQSIILFDGVCKLCNSAVNFVIKRDKNNRIQFAPLQSETARVLLKDSAINASELKSFVFIDKGVLYTESTAALKVCRYLSSLWPLCYGLMVVPRFIRDGFYRWVGKNRYKWFGKKDECMIPTPELRAKFLN
ncbi:MAG: thiol-disulfide oxidoreductase DCC family protein [Ginsengibacter sp.]